MTTTTGIGSYGKLSGGLSNNPRSVWFMMTIQLTTQLFGSLVGGSYRPGEKVGEVPLFKLS